MIDTIWQRLDSSGRLALPFLTAIVCTLLGSIVWPLPYLGAVAPPLALMAIYYWALHRPDLFRPSMAFVIGLLNDTVNFMPLGLSALLFVVAHQLIFRNRRYFVGHSFFMMWLGFVLTVLGVTILQWLMVALMHWQMIPLGPIFIHILFAAAFFPLPCWMLIALQRWTLNTDGQ